jgi:uncharacterized membrane protein
VLSLGFVTGDGPKEADAAVGEDTEFVVVPHSPNLTAGQLIVVPSSNVHETGTSVKRAARLLVTAGVAESEDELVELFEAVEARTEHRVGPADDDEAQGHGRVEGRELSGCPVESLA